MEAATSALSRALAASGDERFRATLSSSGFGFEG
jgi:hypothetical protein